MNLESTPRRGGIGAGRALLYVGTLCVLGAIALVIKAANASGWDGLGRIGPAFLLAFIGLALLMISAAIGYRNARRIERRARNTEPDA